jgi:hypothetical protein
MGLLPEGEVLRATRLNSWVGLAVGGTFVAIGCKFMGNADVLFKSLWIGMSGVVAVACLWQLLKPGIFAIICEDGIRFPSLRSPLISWTDILEARLGPKKTTQGNTTTYTLREPVILRLRNAAVLEGGSSPRWLRGGTTAAMPDGSVEWMFPSDGCPIETTVLLDRIQTRLNPTRAPVPTPEPVAPTFGGKPLSTPSKKAGALLYLGASLFLAFGLFFAGKGVSSLLQAHASRDWPSTQAEVLSSKVEVSTTSGGRDGHTSTSYTPHITYRYTVSGKAYTGTRGAFVYKASSANANAFCKRFPVGARVPAYYDSANPAEAVLVRDGYGMLWIFVAFGAVFASIGGFILLRLLMTRFSTKA